MVKNWLWNMSPVEQSHTGNSVPPLLWCFQNSAGWNAVNLHRFTFCYQCTKKFYLVSHLMACLAAPCHTLKSQVPDNLNT